jgi:hypothetical protein
MRKKLRVVLILTATMAVSLLTSTRLPADTGSCGGSPVTLPFTDVMTNSFFCEIAEAFFSGLTNGTTPTTYSPSGNVPRDQIAAFITRTQDSSLRRGSKRAALQQFWTTTPRYDSSLGGLGTTLEALPLLAASDGEDVWVANNGDATVSRVHGSDGNEIGRFVGATGAWGVLAAMGRVFVTGHLEQGKLYVVDTNPPLGRPVRVVATLPAGASPTGIAFDGSRIWTANNGNLGSVSIITPTATTLWQVSTVSTGFVSPAGILFDGSNIWVAETGGSTLLKLDGNGSIVGTVSVGLGPENPAFDGTNIWVPNALSNTLSVVRASTGTVVATLSGNGLANPNQAAFDGQRILVASGNNSVSLWKAADLTPIGNFSTGIGTNPFGVCSDGTNFWITLTTANSLARF